MQALFQKIKQSMWWGTLRLTCARWVEEDGDQRAAAFAYYQQQTAAEDEIRRLADTLYLKADWQWMKNGATAVSHGWTPEIVLPTIRNYERMELEAARHYGYKASFNPTFPRQPKHEHGWVSPYNFGLNQGPIVLMIENYRSDFLWSLMRQCPYLVTGLRRAGFTGGWLA